MKSFLLLAAAAVISGTTLAQTPGSLLVYTDLGYQTARTETDYRLGNGLVGTQVQKGHAFNTGLGLGYQIDRHWALGINLGLLSTTGRSGDSSNTSASIVTNRSTYFLVGPFLRYTQRLNPTFFGFGQLEASYFGGRDWTEYANAGGRMENLVNGFQTQFYPAFGINVTKHAALSFNFGGIRYRYSEADPIAVGSAMTNVLGQQTGDFAITFGRQANLGVQWFFGEGNHHHMRRRHGRMRGGYREPMQETRRMRDYEDDEEETDEKPTRTRRPAPRPNRYDD